MNQIKEMVDQFAFTRNTVWVIAEQWNGARKDLESDIYSILNLFDRRDFIARLAEYLALKAHWGPSDYCSAKYKIFSVVIEKPRFDKSQRWIFSGTSRFPEIL